MDYEDKPFIIMSTIMSSPKVNVAARNLYSAIGGVKQICATKSLVKGIRLDVCYHRIHDLAPVSG